MVISQVKLSLDNPKLQFGNRSKEKNSDIANYLALDLNLALFQMWQ